MATNNAVNNDLSNPIVRTGIKDSNGNTIISLVPQASSINYVALANAATTGLPIVAAVGSDTNVSLTIKGQGTGQVAILGTGTNDSASAGYVGEYVTNNVPFASAVSLTTATSANVTNISLTAGDWNIEGNVFFNFSGSVGTAAFCCASKTSADTMNENSIISAYQAGATGLLRFYGINVPFLRVSLTATTTVYLCAIGTFASGTATACGSIFARRVR